MNRSAAAIRLEAKGGKEANGKPGAFFFSGGRCQRLSRSVFTLIKAALMTSFHFIMDKPLFRLPG